MPRKRLPQNADLPKGLRVRKGLYSYTNPINKAEKSLGRDRVAAIHWARAANSALKRMLPSISAEQWIQGRIKPTKDDPREYDPERLLSLELIRKLQETSTGGGLYFLMLYGALQYIGISRCVFVRIERHTKEGRIPFDETRCIEVANKAWRETLELAYIGKYLPPYNRAGKPKCESEVMDSARKIAENGAITAEKEIQLLCIP